MCNGIPPAILVHKTVAHVVGKKLFVKRTKTERSHRYVAIPAKVVPVLADHRRRQMASAQSMMTYQDQGWVFANRFGGLLYPQYVRKKFRQLITAAGIPVEDRIKFHELRHTFASWLMMDGSALPMIRDQLGHSSIQTTGDIYSHVLADQRSAAVSTMIDKHLRF